MRADSLDRDVDFRSLSIEQRELLMIQAAKRYYDLNMTIGELSQELGLTRWQARRLLNDAREFRNRPHRDRAKNGAQSGPRKPLATVPSAFGKRWWFASRSTTTKPWRSMASHRRQRSLSPLSAPCHLLVYPGAGR